jgi:hypothetical protein
MGRQSPRRAYEQPPEAYFCDADDADERGVLCEWDTIRWGKPIELDFPKVLAARDS